MPIKVSALSDIGKVRKGNEDSWGAFPDTSLYIVADGMGGHKAGDIASKLAVETIYQVLRERKQLQEVQFEQISHYLNESIQKANFKIFSEGKKNPGQSGMGTTVVATWIHADHASIAYVGDSRAYLFRKNNLRQVTSDHTLVNDYLAKGLLQESEIEHHPLRHVLSRAVGPQEQVEVDFLNLPLLQGDVLLLCTDGLSNMLTKDKIEEILNGPEDLESKNKRLIQQANDSGGSDNVTAMLIEVI
ncbi:MAG: Stp1/IreP family PP2C-type Ser/Thr phosphatase [Nitrospirae bacterium]|nr:Stp1/IreP family PP2C-type Ser/Thr phosphatase [Nitrospirota bacterium]MBI3594440.1 Stp1/IreP family PP2C-type Ser/Thr phosphatase [Nitrospirota bacterium]